MALQLNLNPGQLAAFVELTLGLVHIDERFDFLEAAEISDILVLLADQELPKEVGIAIAAFDFETFDMEGACEKLIEDEIESNDIINLLLHVAQVDEYFDAREHEYISEVADLIGANLDDLEIEIIDGVEIIPPPLP